MKYQYLGRSGLKVSEICLGTMTFGTEFGWGSTKRESRKVFDTFVEAGGNFFDTANYYTKGTSETFLGQFIKRHREKYVLGTKYSLSTDPQNPNAGGNSRKNMTQALEASLKRLNVDYIDLYWVHAWDGFTPIEEIMRALDDMVRAGKILYIGISDMPAWLVAQANTMAELKNWTPFVALQMQYSLIERTIETEFFPLAQKMGLSITAWSPLGGGVLSGKYSQKTKRDARYEISKDWGNLMVTEHNLKIADAVVEIAKKANRTPSQVALNWVRQKGVIPIIGAKNVAQLKENLKSLEFELNDPELRLLDEISNYPIPFPQNFLMREDMQKTIHGDIRHFIDKG